MLKSYKRALCAGMLLLFAMAPLWVSNALTIENLDKKENHVVVNDVEEDLMILDGNNVTVEGDVNGDLIVFSNKVVVTGNVEGNVYAMGSEVDVRGMVGKSLYAVGGTVMVNGEVMRDAFLGSERVTVNGTVIEDLNTLAGKVTINGNVGDGLRVGASDVEVNDSVGGDALLLVNRFLITGSIGGNVYRSEDVIMHSPDFGDFSKSINWSFGLRDLFIANLGMKVFWTLTQSLGYIVVGILLFKFAPIRVEETISRLNEAGDFLKSTLVGFLAFPVGSIIAFMLAISIFGWPVLKALVLLAFLAMTFVTPLAGIWVGRELLSAVGSKRRYIVAVTVGVLAVQLIKTLPIIGWIFGQILMFAVIGALLRMQWSKYKTAQNLSIKMRK